MLLLLFKEGLGDIILVPCDNINGQTHLIIVAGRPTLYGIKLTKESLSINAHNSYLFTTGLIDRFVYH